MGKLEDIEQRIDNLSTNLGRRVDALEDKVFPLVQRRAIRITFINGPLRGEIRVVYDRPGEYKVPLPPVEAARLWREEAAPDHPHLMVAVYRPRRQIGPLNWEYEVAGYTCSGGC